jgi:hypothetical protein
MSGDVNWRKKYEEIKAKWMSTVDVAFRLGFEEGSKQASQDAAQQQQAQAQEQQAAMGGGMGGGQPGGDAMQENGPSQPGDDQSAPMPGGATPKQAPQPAVPMAESEHPDGSELDQHIAKLEGMLSKTEDFDINDLMKTVNDLRSMQKSHKEQLELKKSQQAISGIAKALHKPTFKIGVQAQHNLTSSAKQAVNMQEKIVTDIMQKWEQEENRAGTDILAQLGILNLTKKE